MAARGEDWTRDEVDAAVADYLDMLRAELRGEHVNKTQHRAALRARLSRRSDGSVEFKHQNISAVLAAMGHPFISGYKPASNWQGILADSVAEGIGADRSLAELVARAAEAPADAAPSLSILDRLDRVAPKASDDSRGVSEGRALLVPMTRVNWLERESRNRSLGDAGERFVLDFERAELMSHGRDDLAREVRHVAKEVGDGAGYDIRSFDREGRERWIEVKTTSFARETPFFVTSHEVEVSRRNADRYHLYRVYAYRSDPRLFRVPGAVDVSFRLDAASFRARIA